MNRTRSFQVFYDSLLETSSNPLIPLHTDAAKDEPNCGATIYNHISFVFPDIIPGATDQAGFIDAPVMGPQK